MLGCLRRNGGGATSGTLATLLGVLRGAVSLATFEVAFAGGVACFAGLFTSGMVINGNNAC